MSEKREEIKEEVKNNDVELKIVGDEKEKVEESSKDDVHDNKDYSEKPSSENEILNLNLDKRDEKTEMINQNLQYKDNKKVDGTSNLENNDEIIIDLEDNHEKPETDRI